MEGTDPEVDPVTSNSRSVVTRRIGTQALYVLLGNIFTLVVGWPLQIYVSGLLGASGVGVYGLLEAATMTAANILGVGVGQTVLRFVPPHLERGENGHVVRLIQIGAFALLVLGGAAYVLVLVSLSGLAELWPTISPYRLEITTMGMMIPLGLVGFFLQQCLRAFDQIGYMVLIVSVIQLALKALFTVAAFSAGWRLEGYIGATLAATFCGALWMSGRVLWNIKKLQLPQMVALPLVLPEWRRFALVSFSGSLFGALTWGLDRFLLGALVGTTAVGVLVIARQLQSLPDRFSQMLLMAGTPMFATAHGSGDWARREHLYHLITDWVISASLPLVLFLALFAREILALYGNEFAELGTVPLRILIVGQSFNLAYGPIGFVMLMSGLERQWLGIGIVQVVILGILLVLLTPRFGLVGAASATAVALIFIDAAQLSLARRKLRLRWWARRYLRWLPQTGMALAAGMVAQMWLVPHRMATLGAILITMYAASIVARLLLGLQEDDRDLLRHVRNRVFGTSSRNN